MNPNHKSSDSQNIQLNHHKIAETLALPRTGLESTERLVFVRKLKIKLRHRLTEVGLIPASEDGTACAGRTE